MIIYLFIGINVALAIKHYSEAEFYISDWVISVLIWPYLITMLFLDIEKNTKDPLGMKDMKMPKNVKIGAVKKSKKK